MMECTLDGSYCDYEYEQLSCKMITARKEHRCVECARTIKIGEKYETYKGASDGYIYVSKTCADCVSLRDTFFPNSGYVFGQVREEIAEHISELQGEVDNKCIAPLTPRARDFVFAKIDEAWKI